MKEAAEARRRRGPRRARPSARCRPTPTWAPSRGAPVAPSDFSEFSDRLEFMGAITAVRRRPGRARPTPPAQRAEWAAQEYDRAGRPTPQAKADAMDAPRRSGPGQPERAGAAREPLAVAVRRRRCGPAGGPRRPAEPDHQHDTVTTLPRAVAASDGGGGGGFVPDPNARRRDRDRCGAVRARRPLRLRRRGPELVRLLGPDVVGVGAGRRLPAALGLGAVLVAAPRAARPGPARRHHLLRQLRPPRRPVHRRRPASSTRVTPVPAARSRSGLDVRLRPPLGAPIAAGLGPPTPPPR